jgi:hypothetical protein
MNMNDQVSSNNDSIDCFSNGYEEQSCFDIKQLTEINVEKTFYFKGRRSENQLVDSFPIFKDALNQLGFPEETYLVIKQFIGETVSNAIKSYGSKQLLDEYGSFEAILEHSNSKQIIDDAITEGYDNTVIKFCWLVKDDSLKLKIINNTPLNDYMEDRIKQSLFRDKELTAEELMNIGSEGTLFDTKASGMGIGLWMVKKILEKVERGRVYYLRKEDETEFVIEIQK